MANRILLRSLMNMAGGAIPALISLLTIPFIVKQLGHDGYGLLTLVTAIIGYFAVLDLNFTSGSVKFIAEHNARSERREMCEVISLGAATYCIIGGVGGLLIYIFAEFLTREIFTVSVDFTPLAVRTLQIASVGFFLGQMQTYLSSIPQSLNRFDVSAGFEVAFGTAVPSLTVVLLWMGYGLIEVVMLRVIASLVNVLLLAVTIYRVIPDFALAFPTHEVVKKVTSFSGFAYLSRLAALTYAHSDKLIISALTSMTELTFYAIPTTVTNRVLGLTFRMGSVLYPIASELSALNDLKTLGHVYLSATRYLTYVNTFFVLMICLFSYPILYWWVGEEFAQRGQWIMIVIAVALLIDSLTNLPSLVNDGLGHPKTTGLFAVTRAVIGLALMLVLTRHFGIMGAALGNLVASASMTIAFLIYIHGKTVPVSLLQVVKHGYCPSIFTASALGLGMHQFRATQNLDFFACLLSASFVTVAYVVIGFLIVAEYKHRKELCRFSMDLLGRPG